MFKEKEHPLKSLLPHTASMKLRLTKERDSPLFYVDEIMNAHATLSGNTCFRHITPEGTVHEGNDRIARIRCPNPPMYM